MAKEKEYTSQEAADLVGVSNSRIRQLALAGEIEHRYFGRSLVVTERGIAQARSRKTKRGRTPKDNNVAEKQARRVKQIA